jgi:hypothetical protein
MKMFLNRMMLRNDILHSEKGFILLVAVIACVILMALGIMVWYASTTDLQTSVSALGEKRALAAAESGYHILTQSFDPMATNYNVTVNTWTNVDATYAPGAQYKIMNIRLSDFPAIPPPGYSMESSQGWGVARYDLDVSGRNTSYDTEQQVGIGLGYGPIPLSLVYK